MTFRCTACGADSPSQYVCKSCGAALGPESRTPALATPKVPAPTAPTSTPPVRTPEPFATARRLPPPPLQPPPLPETLPPPPEAASRPLPPPPEPTPPPAARPLPQQATQLPFVVDDVPYRPPRRRISGGLITFALLGIVIGGVVLTFGNRRAPMRWSEDPQVPELLYAVFHDKRFDMHGTKVACRELVQWAHDRNGWLMRPGANLEKDADSVIVHWEPIDNAFDVLLEKSMTAEAMALAQSCSDASKEVGKYLDEVSDGRIKPDYRLDPMLAKISEACVGL